MLSKRRPDDLRRDRPIVFPLTGAERHRQPRAQRPPYGERQIDDPGKGVIDGERREHDRATEGPRVGLEGIAAAWQLLAGGNNVAGEMDPGRTHPATEDRADVAHGR